MSAGFAMSTTSPAHLGLRKVRQRGESAGRPGRHTQSLRLSRQDFTVAVTAPHAKQDLMSAQQRFHGETSHVITLRKVAPSHR